MPGILRTLTWPALYAALTPLWQVYRSTVSRVDKRRLLYLIGVGVLAVTVTAWDHLPQPIGRGGPALGTVLTIVYLYFLQQTLFLDRLLDINELLGKVVVLSAFVLLLFPAIIMIGLLPPDEFERNLVMATAVSPSTAEQVIEAMNAAIFEPIHQFVMSGGKKPDALAAAGIELEKDEPAEQPAAQPQAADVGRVGAEQAARELVLPRAHEAEQADDLAGVQVE